MTSSGRTGGLARAVPLAALAAHSALVLSACAGARAPAPLAPLTVARTEVSPGAASVAWSPDGAELAVVQAGGVRVLDVGRGTSRVVSGPGAVALDWAPARALLVVERDARGARVVEVAPDTGERRVLHEDPALVGARWLDAGAGWAAIGASAEVLAYGTQATLTFTTALGSARPMPYRWSTLLPTRDPSADPGLGWRDARPNPVDHGFLLPEFRKPPQFPPHVQLVSIDPFQPERRPVARLEAAGWGAVGSWAPDGRRAAIAAADGALRVLEPDGKLSRPVGPASGLHPSWHPFADVIFLGGWLVDPAGTPLRQLLREARAAVACWSPAGDRLAVASSGTLFVFGDLALPGASPRRGDAEHRRAGVRAALRELGALRAEGLVAPAVYLEYRDRLRSRPMEER